MTVGEIKDAPPGKEFNTPPRKTQVDDIANATTNYKIPNSSAKLITEKAELNEFHEAVAQRVSEYDAADDEARTFKETEEIGFMYLVRKYWDFSDKIMFHIGMGTSCVMGASLPAFCFLFGKGIDSVGAQEHDETDQSFDGLG